MLKEIGDFKHIYEKHLIGNVELALIGWSLKALEVGKRKQMI